MPPSTAVGGAYAHGVIVGLCILGQLLVVLSKQTLPLPHFKPIGQEFGPLCVKAKQGVCSGKPRSYQTVGTIMNGSYQAPEFADMNGDGMLDLITVHTGNNTVMIFYNQGYGADRLPVFEAAASVIVPSNRTIRAVHPMVAHTGAAASGPILLLSMDIGVYGDLIIPMLDNVGTATEPQLVWRYGNDSLLRTVDLKEAFAARGIFANLRKQGTDVSVLLGVRDMDNDGDLDLVVQLTWVTLYYENMGLPRPPGLTFVERPDVNLLSTSLRFFAPPVIFDMDNDGDYDVITFVGDRVHGTMAVVYENIGTRYYPEMHRLDSHPIVDLYESVCTDDYSDCTLSVHDYNRDGHKDILVGGADVGGIRVYPQGRATIFLYETKWNQPFSMLQSDSSTFSFQDFVDADGDGLVDMYVSSWLINPIRTLQVDAYQNQGTTAEPKFVLQSTYTHAGGLSYFTFTALLNRTNAKTGLPIYDFLLTNGTETVYVLRNNNEANLNITSLTEPEPLFAVGCPAGRIYFFDGANGRPDMFILNAYGDLDGMFESQIYTTSNETRPFFQEKHQQSCNRINTFIYTNTTSWRDGISRPVFSPSGLVTFNFTGCISDIVLGDYGDKTIAAMVAIAVPQSRVYQFEKRDWSGRDHLIQLSEGAEFTEARVEADTPISISLVDLDSDGRGGLMVSYVFGVRRWRNDYCQLEYPCWKGGKCDLTLFTPKCDCSTGFTGDLCDTCAENHFGRNCESCPTDRAGSVCSSKGFCNWGDFASGDCICTSPFEGSNCSNGACPAGTETQYNYENATFECDACQSAYYKEKGGHQPCSRCPPFSRASDDRTTCDCNPDYYLSEVDDMLACKACPSPMITIKEAATSIHDCVCPAGYYLVQDGAEEDGAPHSDTKPHYSGSCMLCPEGAACTVPGITLETLPLLPHYWRISHMSASIGRCKLRAACPGTDLGHWKQDVWLKGGEWRGFEDSLCAAGYVGPFCSACAPGHFKRNRRCLPCAPKAITTRNVVLVFIMVVILALGTWLAYRRVVTPHIQRVFNVEPEPQPTQAQLQQPSSPNRPHALSTAANPMLRSPISNANEHLSSGVSAGRRSRSMSTREVVLALPVFYKRVRTVVGVKLRLLIIYLQVVSCLWNILDLDASEDTPIDDVMSALQWFDLDFAAFPSYQCVVGDNYFDILLVYTYTPVLILALIWGATLLLCRRARWEVNKVAVYKDYASTASLGLCFLLFAGGSTRLLNFFACVHLDDGHLYNTTDMRVRCDVASYQAMMPFVVLGIFLYPIGITCLYAYLLYTDRARICARPGKSVGEMIALRDADQVAKRSRFLWSPYEPRVWWFEVAECIRRLSLTAFLSVYQTGKTQQTVAAILLSVAAIIVFDHYMPYLSDEDDAMGKACNYVTLLTFLVALLTKLDFISRVYITELLLFLLALCAAACGVALALKQLSDPAPLPYSQSRALGRRRSSVLKKHLKTIAAESGDRTGRQSPDDAACDSAPRSMEQQAEEATLARSSVQLDGTRSLRQRDQLSLSGRGVSPPLPDTHHPMSSQHGAPSPGSFDEPEPASLSTTFNAMLNFGSTGGARGDERPIRQLNDSGPSLAAALWVTGRPSAEGGRRSSVTPPVSDVAPPDTNPLTVVSMQAHARVGSPSSPPPPE